MIYDGLLADVDPHSKYGKQVMFRALFVVVSTVAAVVLCLPLWSDSESPRVEETTSDTRQPLPVMPVREAASGPSDASLTPDPAVNVQATSGFEVVCDKDEAGHPIGLLDVQDLLDTRLSG